MWAYHDDKLRFYAAITRRTRKSPAYQQIANFIMTNQKEQSWGIERKNKNVRGNFIWTQIWIARFYCTSAHVLAKTVYVQKRSIYFSPQKKITHTKTNTCAYLPWRFVYRQNYEFMPYVSRSDDNAPAALMAQLCFRIPAAAETSLFPWPLWIWEYAWKSEISSLVVMHNNADTLHFCKEHIFVWKIAPNDTAYSTCLLCRNRFFLLIYTWLSADKSVGDGEKSIQIVS